MIGVFEETLVLEDEILSSGEGEEIMDIKEEVVEEPNTVELELSVEVCETLEVTDEIDAEERISLVCWISVDILWPNEVESGTELEKLAPDWSRDVSLIELREGEISELEVAKILVEVLIISLDAVDDILLARRVETSEDADGDFGVDSVLCVSALDVSNDSELVDETLAIIVLVRSRFVLLVAVEVEAVPLDVKKVLSVLSDVLDATLSI